MNRLVVLVLLADALFAAAGGAAEPLGAPFAAIGILAWFVAFVLDLAWDA